MMFAYIFHKPASFHFFFAKNRYSKLYNLEIISALNHGPYEFFRCYLLKIQYSISFFSPNTKNPCKIIYSIFPALLCFIILIVVLCYPGIRYPCSIVLSRNYNLVPFIFVLSALKHIVQIIIFTVFFIPPDIILGSHQIPCYSKHFHVIFCNSYCFITLRSVKNSMLKYHV